LNITLERIRERRGLPSSFAFRFSNCATAVREEFFRATADLPLQSWVLVIDKRQWTAEDLRLRGPERLNRHVADLVSRCPQESISKQIVLIDLPKKENAVVLAQRAAILARLRTLEYSHAPQINACPDHRIQGAIVQAADMVAGAVQRESGLLGPLLGPMYRRVHLF
jgi:hypothetical protein